MAVPAAGAAGTRVEITGEGVELATGVQFAGGGGPATVLQAGPGRLRVLVPVVARTGPLRVLLPGRVLACAAPFRVLPSLGPLPQPTGRPGTELRLAGTGLAHARQLRFGTVFADPDTLVREPGGTWILARVPSGAPPGPITVFTPDGQASAPGIFTVAYQVPLITGMEPSRGLPGSTVVLTGEHLEEVTELRYRDIPLGPGSYGVDLPPDGGPATLVARLPFRAANGAFTARNPAGHRDGPSFQVLRPATRALWLEQPLVRSVDPFSGVLRGDPELMLLDFPGRNRTRQYLQFQWPRAPIFHAYHPYTPDPGPLGKLRPGHEWPRVVINLQLPAEFLEAVPAPLLEPLRTLGFPAEQADLFCVSQDQPYDAPLLFRPHYWLYPDTPAEGLATESRQTALGIWAATPDLHLVGHSPGAFLPPSAATVTTVHPTAGPPMGNQTPSAIISSPNNLRMTGFDPQHTRVCWSLVYDGVRPGVPPRAAITLHLLLNDQDQRGLEALARRVFRLRDLAEAMQHDLPASPATTALLALLDPGKARGETKGEGETKRTSETRAEAETKDEAETKGETETQRHGETKREGGSRSGTAEAPGTPGPEPPVQP